MVDISEPNQQNDLDLRSTKLAPARMRGGVISSLALHVLALLLIGLSWQRQEALRTPIVVSVNLVRFGPLTVSPSSTQTALVPQDKTKAVLKPQPAEAMATQAVPQPEPPQRPAPIPKVTKEPAQKKPDLPVTTRKPRVHVAVTVAHALPPSPNQELAARLKLLAQLRQPAQRTSHRDRQQDGAGVSNVTAGTDTLHGRDARYAVKDFIRAQVERRWNLDRMEMGANDWIVAIHIVLGRDGTVRRAEIVSDPRILSNGAYHDFALSARNAVLLSSPLALPRGAYAIAKDIVVDFDSRQVLR